jgi:hypothetical protein
MNTTPAQATTRHARPGAATAGASVRPDEKEVRVNQTAETYADADRIWRDPVSGGIR